MTGLIHFFVLNILIKKANGLIIVDNVKQIANLTMKLETSPTFTNKTIQSHLKVLNFETYPKDLSQSEPRFSKNIVIQNQCNYNNFYDEDNKVHYCPSYEQVNLHDGVYYILEGCSSIHLSEPEKFSWIITNKDEVNLFDLKISRFSKRFVFKKPISCMEVCLQFCEDKEKFFNLGINDLIVLTILISFFCGFLICYPCYMLLMKFKVSNKVEDFE